jgi:hypothetical protein
VEQQRVDEVMRGVQSASDGGDGTPSKDFTSFRQAQARMVLRTKRNF